MLWVSLLLATSQAALLNEDDYEGGGIGSGTLGAKYLKMGGGYTFNDKGEYVSDCADDGTLPTYDDDNMPAEMKDFVQEDAEIACIQSVRQDSFNCDNQGFNDKVKAQCNKLKGEEGLNMIDRLSSNKARDMLCDVHKAVLEHNDVRRRRMMGMATDQLEGINYHWNSATFPELRDPDHPTFKALWRRRVARRRRLAECTEDSCDSPDEDEFGYMASAEDFDTELDCEDDEGVGSGYGADHAGMSFVGASQAFPELVSSSLCTVGDTDRRLQMQFSQTRRVEVGERRRAGYDYGDDYYGDGGGDGNDYYDADPNEYYAYFGDGADDGMGENAQCSSPNEFIAQAAEHRRRLWGLSVGVASSSCGNYVIAGEANSGCNNRPCLKLTGSFGLAGGCPFYNWAVKYRRWTCNTCWRCSWSSCPGWYSCNCAWREMTVVDGGRNLCCSTVDITPVWSPIDVEIEGCFFSEASCNGQTGSCGKGYKFDLNLSALFGLASYNANLACDANHQFLNCCGRRRLMPFLTDEEAHAAGLLTLDDVGGNADFLNY